MVRYGFTRAVVVVDVVAACVVASSSLSPRAETRATRTRTPSAAAITFPSETAALVLLFMDVCAFW
ncbi:hypothetical protein RSPPQCQH_CDS0049 [Mycolicibacterium phage phi1_186001]